MSRVSTDYTGRIVDISTMVLTENEVSPQAHKIPLSYGGTTKVIAGVQKAVQAFVTTLFTRKGEAWDPSAGCNFLTSMQTGRVRTPIDAQNYFSVEVSGVLLQINNASGPNDEYITSAVLLSAVVARDSITLRIQITTRAGVGVTVLVPVEKSQ